MSGAQTSTFADPNILYKTLSGAGYQEVEQNRLLNQQRTQDIGEKDMAMVGQAGASLLNLNEDQAAAAYPQVRDSLQAQGFGKNLPATYPGHAVTQAFVQRAMPLIDQYKMGLMTSPGTQAILDRVFPSGTTPQAGGGAGTGTGTTTGGTVATGGAGTLSGDTYEGAIGGHEGLGADKTLPSTVGGFRPGTWQSFVTANPNLFAGMSADQAMAARSDPKFNAAGISWLAQQNATQLAQAGVKPSGMALGIAHYIGAGAAAKALQAPDNTPIAAFVSPDAVRYNPELGTLTVGQLKARYAGVPDPGFLRTATGGAPGSPQAPSGPPPGVQMGGDVPPPPGGAPGAYPAQGAGVGAVVGGGVRPNIGGPQLTVAPPPVIRAQPIPAGRTTVGSNADIMMGGVQQAQATPLPGTQVAGPPMVASTQPTAAVPAPPVETPTPTRYAGTAPAPSAEAPPQPGWGSQVGSGYGPQNTLAPPLPPAAQPVAQTPPPAQQPPAARAPLATGASSPQYQQGLQYMRQAAAIKAMPGYAYNPQLQAAAAYLEQLGSGQMKLETFQEDTQGGIHGQRNVLTNQFTPDPARRMMALPDGTVINDQGRPIAKVPPQELVKDAENQYWYIPKYPTAGPGGSLVPPQPAGGNLPTPGFVEEQKVEATRLSKLRSEVLDRAKESAQANTMIANTETALQEAQKGNLGPGALSPDKLQIVATAKAMGINLAPFGIDADKLAAAQVTREQLQQLNGAILRKMYPQRITNADLAISGTVLPNYGLDTGALTSNFEIYKKQNDYDTRMAQDMLDYQDQHHTLVGWENQWHKKAGFGAGPIDNLFGDAQAGRLTSGGKGGGGSQTQPTQSSPTTLPVAPVNPSARTKGTTYQTPKGPLTWTGTAWEKP